MVVAFFATTTQLEVRELKSNPKQLEIYSNILFDTGISLFYNKPKVENSEVRNI